MMFLNSFLCDFYSSVSDSPSKKIKVRVEMESAAPASDIREKSVSPPTFGGGSGGGAAGMSTDPLTQLYSIFNLLYGSE